LFFFLLVWSFFSSTLFCTSFFFLARRQRGLPPPSFFLAQSRERWIFFSFLISSFSFFTPRFRSNTPARCAGFSKVVPPPLARFFEQGFTLLRTRLFLYNFFLSRFFFPHCPATVIEGTFLGRTTQGVYTAAFSSTGLCAPVWEEILFSVPWPLFFRCLVLHYGLRWLGERNHLFGRRLLVF